MEVSTVTTRPFLLCVVVFLAIAPARGAATNFFAAARAFAGASVASWLVPPMLAPKVLAFFLDEVAP